MMGSSTTGDALRKASRKAYKLASLKAISLESTACALPSVSAILMPCHSQPWLLSAMHAPCWLICMHVIGCTSTPACVSVAAGHDRSQSYDGLFDLDVCSIRPQRHSRRQPHVPTCQPRLRSEVMLISVMPIRLCQLYKVDELRGLARHRAGQQCTSTGCPVRWPELHASRKPFSQAGRNAGGMALPTTSFSNCTFSAGCPVAAACSLASSSEMGST